MTELSANICPSDNHIGTTLSIEGGSLHVGDRLRLICSTAKEGSATIRRFGPGQLDLEMDGQMLVCRSWQAGDPPVHRRHGTSSSWIVARVETGDVLRT
jgi:hypothetical protein